MMSSAVEQGSEPGPRGVASGCNGLLHCMHTFGGQAESNSVCVHTFSGDRGRCFGVIPRGKVQFINAHPVRERNTTHLGLRSYISI